LLYHWQINVWILKKGKIFVPRLGEVVERKSSFAAAWDSLAGSRNCFRSWPDSVRLRKAQQPTTET
jgi:hypothetical protein